MDDTSLKWFLSPPLCLSCPLACLPYKVFKSLLSLSHFLDVLYTRPLLRVQTDVIVQQLLPCVLLTFALCDTLLICMDKYKSILMLFTFGSLLTSV